MTAITGIYKPILAMAEPRAKFKLLCKHLALAALTAANPSGRRTSIAIAIPTIVLGAPAAFTPASIAGLSNSARPTTMMSDRISSAVLAVVLRLLGLCA